jgi:predicted  nucleic acid-binding Zn-ribbon protein
VTETFKLISKLTFVDLLRRLQGRRAEEDAAAAAQVAAPDDLQTWKDSLLNRESQSTPIQPQAPQSPREQRPSRPLSLVPPVSEMAPFDTTELAEGVDDDEAPESPYAVQEPAAADEPRSPAQTIRMEAIREDLLDAGEPIESLTEADEVEVELEPPTSQTDPSFFLPSEAAPPPSMASSVHASSQPSSVHTSSSAPSAPGPEIQEALRTLAALQERAEATAASVAGLAERLAGMEKGVGGLNESLHSLTQRLASLESDMPRQADPEVERGLKALETRLSELDDRLRSEATHQRKDADDVAMALRGLNERSQNLDQQMTSLTHQLGAHQGTLMQLSGLGDRFPALESQLASFREAIARLPELEAHQGALKDTVARLPELAGHLSMLQDTIARLPEVEAQVASLEESASKVPEIEGRIHDIVRGHQELESTLEEKTHQGRREAEDIRSQIAPLLEERVRRHESDALLFAEMERLRESLAESLHDLAERVRSRVRE